MLLFAPGTDDFVPFEIGRDFQCQSAGAGQKHEFVDPPHNVAYLMHLFFRSLLLLDFCIGLAQGDFFPGQSGGRDDCAGVRYFTEGI